MTATSTTEYINEDRVDEPSEAEEAKNDPKCETGNVAQGWV